VSKYGKTFEPSMPLLARRPFSINGRRYSPGDKFDWRKLSVSTRRVSQMFDAGKLMHPENDKKQEALDDLADASQYWDKSSEDYNLEEIDDMKELRRIADTLGAPYKVSKADQRKAIRDHLEEND